MKRSLGIHDALFPLSTSHTHVLTCIAYPLLFVCGARALCIHNAVEKNCFGWEYPTYRGISWAGIRRLEQQHHQQVMDYMLEKYPCSSGYQGVPLLSNAMVVIFFFSRSVVCVVDAGRTNTGSTATPSNNPRPPPPP